MSKLNKLVTNYPVSLSKDEVANLSSTLLPVVEACGGGGGGGITQYYGDGTYTEITGSHVITLTNETKQKINRTIPTKVSDLTDSANYQTVEGMDQYLTEAEAQATYLTKSSADTLYAPLSTTADIEALKANSGDFSQYYTKNETYSKNEVYTKEDVYQKTETSSISELEDEFSKYATEELLIDEISIVNQTIYDLQDTVDGKQDTLTFGKDGTGAISSINSTALAGQGGTTYSAGQYINIDANDTISVTGVLALDEYAQYEPVLIGDSNITATSSKVDTHTQWNLRINATPVTTDTTLKGENVVTAHTTQVSGEWAVGLVQSAYEAIDSVDGIATDVGTLKAASADWDKVSDKLDTTAFSTVSGTFLTTIPDTYALKTDIPTTVAQLTDSGNYYKTTETSSKNELSTEFAKYIQTISTGVGLSGDGKTTALGIDTTASINLTNGSAKSAASAYVAEKYINSYGNPIPISGIESTMDKCTNSLYDLTYNSIGDYGIIVTENPDNYDMPMSVELTTTALNAVQYVTANSGKFVTSGDYISGNFQYALTTAGWDKVQGGTSFTGVTTASPITGDGLNNTLGLDSNYKTAIEQVSGKVDKPADMTSNTPYCFSGGQWADITQTYYSKTEATGTFLQKNLTNTLSGDGTSNNTLGVNWSNLSSNTINSANSAGEAKGFRWSDNSYQDTSAALTNLWNNKNHVTIQSANNVLTVDNNDNTSATLNTVVYTTNTGDSTLKAQRLYVALSDNDIISFVNGGGCEGQGTLFFRLENTAANN